MRPAWTVPLLLGWTALTVAVQEPSHLERGRELTRLFYEEELETLWERFSAPMKAHFVDLEGWRRFRAQVGTELGPETALVAERTATPMDQVVYARTAAFEKAEALFLVQWSFDADGRVTGVSVSQALEAPSRYLGRETETHLRLPFRGEWHVAWGGRDVASNQHARAKDQRFAYDFVILQGGSSHEGSGESNEDYHCFGEPLLAPGAGTVRAVENDVEDNVPGVLNTQEPMGNYVVIDHGDGEFSFLAHFRRGTVRVEPGDPVRPGDLLGECGNSGRSSEPHLHYHLQDTPVPFQGEGLPAQFRHYVADGEPVARGEPLRRQAVRPRDEEPQEPSGAPSPEGE